MKQTQYQETIEDNETLKKCMKWFNDNKMNKTNVWTTNIIEALSNIVSNNQESDDLTRLASFLEASGKVYAFRVDCLHADVLRLTHGNCKRKVTDIGTDPDINNHPQPAKKRMLVATVTRNPERINGRLDTYPSADPVWGKLNSVIKDASSPSNFLQNFMFSEGGILKMSYDYNYWNKEDSEDHSKKQSVKEISEMCLLNVPRIDQIHLNGRVLRAKQSEYEISNIPGSLDEILESEEMENYVLPAASPVTIPIVFDMEARVEPDDVIEDHDSDLRPVNSESLEYSYRKMDCLDPYWACPSHWKFLCRNTPNTVRQRSARKREIKTKSKPLDFTKNVDHLFLSLFKNKPKKTNLTESWFSMNLKFPENFKHDYHPANFFDKYTLAPNWTEGTSFRKFPSELETDLITEIEIFLENEEDNLFDSGLGDMDESMFISTDIDDVVTENPLEISEHFIEAPDNVTRIVVPFVKRAKVIDMKQLKRFSLESINNQFFTTRDQTDLKHYGDETYLPGIATFSEVYKSLSHDLPKSMIEVLSPSIALYSVLHLCNENNLRILSQRNLKDFTITKFA